MVGPEVKVFVVFSDLVKAYHFKTKLAWQAGSFPLAPPEKPRACGRAGAGGRLAQKRDYRGHELKQVSSWDLVHISETLPPPSAYSLVQARQTDVSAAGRGPNLA